MRGSSPRMTKKIRESANFPLDNIPRCVYIVSICSVKEAVIRKTSSWRTWSSCRLSQGPRGTLAGTDGGGSAVGPPLFALQLGGARPTQLIFEINGSGRQSYSSK